MPTAKLDRLETLKKNIRDELTSHAKLKRLISETNSSLATARNVLGDAKRARADAEAQAEVDAVLGAPAGDNKALARFRIGEERAIEEAERFERLADGLLGRLRQVEARLLELGDAIEHELMKTIGPVIDGIRRDIQHVMRPLVPLLARWFAVYSHGGAALVDHAAQLRIPVAGSPGWILNWPYFFDADGSSINIPRLAREDSELKALTDGIMEARTLRRRCKLAG